MFIFAFFHNFNSFSFHFVLFFLYLRVMLFAQHPELFRAQLFLIISDWYHKGDESEGNNHKNKLS